MSQALPAKPDLDWLAARCAALGKTRRQAASGRLAVANDYGFWSWRALKVHVDGIDPTFRSSDRVFEAASAGDVEPELNCGSARTSPVGAGPNTAILAR